MKSSRARWGIHAAALTAIGALAAGVLATLPAVAESTAAGAAAADTYEHTYTIGCGAQGVADLISAFKDIGGYWTQSEMGQGHRLTQNGERDLIVLAESCTYDFAKSFDGATALPSISGGYYGTGAAHVTIQGNGATFARTGSDRYRFLAVNNAASSLTVSDLTFSNGAAPHGAGISADPFLAAICGPLGALGGCYDSQADSGGSGGAIANSGTLRLTGVTLAYNNAGTGHEGSAGVPGGFGGDGGSGGAVYGSPGSSVIVDASAFLGNRAGNGGQGSHSGRLLGTPGYGGNGGDGGAIGAFGHLQITDSTFRTNLAGGPGDSGTDAFGSHSLGGGGGLYGDGGAVAVFGDAASIEASSFIDNGNLAGRGGAVAAHSPVTLTNSTFQHNGASYGGAIADTATTVTIRNSDFVDNYSDNTGDVVAGGYGGTVDVANSVIVRTGSGAHAACSASTAGWAADGANANTPLGYTLHNVWVEVSGAAGACDGTGVSTGSSGLPSNPALNGGTTLSFAPAADSPLLDAGDPTYCQAHDQRGLPRDASDGGCDIGSIDHFTWPATSLSGPDLDPAYVALNHGYPNGYKGITQNYPTAYFFSAPVITDPAAHYKLVVFNGGVQHDYETDKNGDPLRDLSLLPVTFAEAGATTAELWVTALDQWVKVGDAAPFRVLLAKNTAPKLSIAMDDLAGTWSVDEFSTHHFTVTVTDPDTDAGWSFAKAPTCGSNAALSDLTVSAHSFAFDCAFGAGGDTVTSKITATVVDDQFEQSVPLNTDISIIDAVPFFKRLNGPSWFPINTTGHYDFSIIDGHEDLVALAAKPTWVIRCGAHLTGPTNVQATVDGTTLKTTFDCTSDGTGLNTFNNGSDTAGNTNLPTRVIFDPRGTDGAPAETPQNTNKSPYTIVVQSSIDIGRVYVVGTANPATAESARLGSLFSPASSDIAHTRIDWGDGTVETYGGWAGTVNGGANTYTHPYVEGGKHTVTVSVDLTSDPGTWVQVATTDAWDYDSAAPVLTLPDPIELSNAAPGESDRAHYIATATDPVNGTYAATCSVADGTRMPVGTTTVSCSAKGNGQTVNGTFKVAVRDQQPPVIGIPTITQDKQSDGVHVHLDVPFTDDAPGTGKAVCDPASDSVFAQGTTLVTCTATDAAGNIAKTSFAVAVADGTGPIVNVPSSILGSSPDGSGVTRSFTVTATDVKGAALTPVCLPASGSVFATGTTTVSCSATDAQGNVTVATFPVVVSGGTVSTWADLTEEFENGGGVVGGRRTVTVKLAADIAVASDSDGVGSQLRLAPDDEATLDLAGHDLSIDAAFGVPAIGVPAEADLHVIDSVGGGRLTLAAHAGAAAIGGGICQGAGDVTIAGVAGSAVAYADGQMAGAAGIGSGAEPDAATLANWGASDEAVGDCSAALDGGTVTFSGAAYAGVPTSVHAPSGAVGAAIAWATPTSGKAPTRLSAIRVAGDSDGVSFAPSGWLTVDLEGGASTDTDPGGPLADPDHVELSEPTRDGYLFGGWRKGSTTGPAWSYTPQTAADDAESQTSFTVHASWIPLAAGADCSKKGYLGTRCQLVLQPGDDDVLDVRGGSWMFGQFDADGNTVGTRPGIELPSGAKLTVVDSVGTGNITAYGGDGAAGIGGAAGAAGGTLVDQSGEITAVGSGGAGIGGGAHAPGGVVTLAGGFLSTMSTPWSGGDAGAGIGAGDGAGGGGTLAVQGTPFAGTTFDAATGTAPGVDAPGATITITSGAQQYDGWSGADIGPCSGDECTGSFVQLGHPATFHLNGGDAGATFVDDGDTQLYEPAHGVLGYVKPMLAGSDFAGWYLDAALTDKVQAWTRFAGPVDLYAKYTETLPALTADTAPVLDTDGPQYFGTPVAVSAPSGFSASDATVHYDWIRCTITSPVRCSDIAGAADKATYTPRLADLDRQLKVKVTAIADGATPYAWTSGVTRTVQTGKFVAQQVQYAGFGAPTVGKALTLTWPGWNEVPQRIDYVWQRNGTPISGAPDAASYIPVAADLGATLSVAVTARGDGYDTWTITGTASDVVANGILTDAPQPTIAITAPTGSTDTTHALIGSRLTAAPGAWPSGTTYAYQWYRNDGTGEAAIDGATDATYTVPVGSAYDYLSVHVTGTAPGYNPRTTISDSLRVPALDVSIPQLRIDASNGVCSTVTPQQGLAYGQIACAVVPDLPSGATITGYQWYRDGTAADNHLSVPSGYYLAAADVNHTITVAVTVTATGYDPVTVTSAPGFANVEAALNTTAPVLSGTAVVGEKLTVTDGTWTFLPTYWTYTWLRDGDAIAGAGGSCSDGGDCSAKKSYVLQPDDAGHTITADVTWWFDSNSLSELNGKTSAPSNALGPVALATQTTTTTPMVTGSGKVGTSLTAVPGTWDDGVGLHYVWRSGSTVVGSDAAQLVLTPAMLGGSVTVSVTGHKAGYVDVTKTSADVDVVEGDLTTTPTPVVLGSGKVGTSLTAAPGTWDDGVTLHYVWRSGSTVVGSDGAQLVLTPAMLGGAITLAVTGQKDGYTDVVRTSAGVTVVEGDQVSTPVPTIAGSGKVGTSLTAVPGTWDDGVTLHYVWRSGSTVVGSDAAQLVLTPAMLGGAITLAVTSHKDGYTDATRTSAALAVLDGDLSATPTPTISGSAKVGTTLSAVPGSWDDGASVQYRWSDGGTVLAIDAPLTLGADQVGHTITLSVTGSRAGYASVTRTATVTVTPGDLTPGTPVIGTTAPAVGDTISVTTGTWGPGAVRTTLQWYADGVPIAGATAATLTIGAAQVGRSISAGVTGAVTGYTTRQVMSAATASVRPGTITHTGSVTVGGKAKAGKKLTAKPGAFRAGGSAVTVKYQWLANGTAIKGATRPTLKIGAAQRGKKLSVRVTATAAGYTSVSATSPKTKKVPK